MADVVIVKEGEVVGRIADDGFYTDDQELIVLLQRAFDGDGAKEMVGGHDEKAGVYWDGFVNVKPDDPKFPDILKDDMARNGYILAVP